jgi:hypothetical protein
MGIFDSIFGRPPAEKPRKEPEPGSDEAIAANYLKELEKKGLGGAPVEVVHGAADFSTADKAREKAGK